MVDRRLATPKRARHTTSAALSQKEKIIFPLGPCNLLAVMTQSNSRLANRASSSYEKRIENEHFRPLCYGLPNCLKDIMFKVETKIGGGGGGFAQIKSVDTNLVNDFTDCDNFICPILALTKRILPILPGQHWVLQARFSIVTSLHSLPPQ